MTDWKQAAAALLAEEDYQVEEASEDSDYDPLRSDSESETSLAAPLKKAAELAFAKSKGDNIQAAAEALQKSLNGAEETKGSEALEEVGLVAATERMHKNDTSAKADDAIDTKRDQSIDDPTANSIEDIEEEVGLVATAERMHKNDTSAKADESINTKRDQSMDDPTAKSIEDIEHVASWKEKDTVEVYFQAAKVWVDATILGRSSKHPGSYDVRYDDGSGLERGVVPTLIRARRSVTRKQPKEPVKHDYTEESAEEDRQVQKQKVSTFSAVWHEGDMVQVDGISATVVSSSHSKHVEVRFSDTGHTKKVSVGKVKSGSGIFAKATTAAAARLRDQSCVWSTREELKTALRQCGIGFEKGRKSAKIKIEDFVVLPTAGTEIKANIFVAKQPYVIVVGVAGGDLCSGDEILTVGGAPVSSMARSSSPKEDEEDSPAVATSTIERHCREGKLPFRVRRVTAQVLSLREFEALFFGFCSDKSPRETETELTVVIDECRRALAIDQRKNPDATFDKARTACNAQKSSAIQSNALARYFASLSLPLYAPGYDDDAEKSPLRSMTQQQATDIVSRFLDVSNDGVISKQELTDFVFGKARSITELKEQMLEIVSCGSDQFFNTLDSDGNGVLGRNELEAGLAKLGLFLLPAETSILVSTLDADGDGITGRSELSDFLGLPPYELCDRQEIPVDDDISSCCSADEDLDAREAGTIQESVAPLDKKASSCREALAVSETRCLELEDANARLRRRTTRLRDQLKSTIAQERKVAGLPSFEERIRHACVVAREARLCCAHRSLASKSAASEACLRRDRFECERRLLKCRRDHELQKEANVELRAQLRDAQHSLRRQATSLPVTKEIVHEEKDKKLLDAAEATARLSTRRASALEAESVKLKMLLNEARDRERSAVHAWRAAVQREGINRKALVDTEVDCQNQLRRARTTVELALQRAELCEFRLQDTLAKVKHAQPIVAVVKSTKSKTPAARRPPNASISYPPSPPSTRVRPRNYKSRNMNTKNMPPPHGHHAAQVIRRTIKKKKEGQPHGEKPRKTAFY